MAILRMPTKTITKHRPTNLGGTIKLQQAKRRRGKRPNHTRRKQNKGAEANKTPTAEKQKIIQNNTQT